MDELTYEDKQILSVLLNLAYSLLDTVEALELKGEGNYVTKNDIFALAEKLGVDVWRELENYYKYDITLGEDERSFVKERLEYLFTTKQVSNKEKIEELRQEVAEPRDNLESAEAQVAELEEQLGTLADRLAVTTVTSILKSVEGVTFDKVTSSADLVDLAKKHLNEIAVHTVDVINACISYLEGSWSTERFIEFVKDFG